METTLHQQLKRCYAQDDDSTEVVLGQYRIDAICDDELIEVQCASLSAIREKCHNLLKRHQLRVVKPVVMRTRIAKAQKQGGPVTSRRLSPKRGNLLELFDELIYFTRVFPHPNLVIEVPLIEIEQLRLPGKKRKRRWHKDFKIGDVRLETIQRSVELRTPADLLALLNMPPTVESFNTADLAKIIDRPRWHAQQIAYVLRKTGAIDSKGRDRSGIIYHRAA
ncbi:MAG: hypothetical protein L7W43_16085 [Rubripirellula sp.]|nr:hypothetical protein [Rubripirellula sp.]